MKRKGRLLPRFQKTKEFAAAVKTPWERAISFVLIAGGRLEFFRRVQKLWCDEQPLHGGLSFLQIRDGAAPKE